MPIISASTQSRAEGYFRLEWRLADQRTHLMGRNRAFIFPVCVDQTPDAGADVPDSFFAVQWTRLPDGETSSAVAEHVRRLLGGDSAARGSGPVISGSSAGFPPARLGTQAGIPLSGTTHHHGPETCATTDGKSVAVLAFANLSNDAEN